MKSGEDFYIMLDTNGMLYSFGNKNDMGQLGYNNLKPGKDVKKIDFNKIVIDFDVGLNHVVLLTDEKKVYSFGDNRNGQLGLDSILEYSLTPKLLDLSFNGSYTNVKEVECIDDETYIIDESDNVYYCGNGIIKPEKLDDEHNYVLIKKDKNKRFFKSRGNEEYYLDLCGNFTYKKIYEEPFYFKVTEHIDTINNNQLEVEKSIKMIGKSVITNDQKAFGSIYNYNNNIIVRVFTLFKDKYIRKGGDIVSDDLKVVFKDKLLMNSLGNRIAIEVELNEKVGFQIYNFGGGQYSDGDIEMKNFQNIDEDYYRNTGIIKSEK